jgi:hypothetical protein
MRGWHDCQERPSAQCQACARCGYTHVQHTAMSCSGCLCQHTHIIAEVLSVGCSVGGPNEMQPDEPVQWDGALPTRSQLKGRAGGQNVVGWGRRGQNASCRTCCAQGELRVAIPCSQTASTRRRVCNTQAHALSSYHSYQASHPPQVHSAPQPGPQPVGTANHLPSRSLCRRVREVTQAAGSAQPTVAWGAGSRAHVLHDTLAGIRDAA